MFIRVESVVLYRCIIESDRSVFVKYFEIVVVFVFILSWDLCSIYEIEINNVKS